MPANLAIGGETAGYGDSLLGLRWGYGDSLLNPLIRFGPRLPGANVRPVRLFFEVSLGGNTTRFLYNGDALVAEYDYAGTTMTKRYAHWVGQPAPAEAGVPLVSYEGASLETATARWLFADHQGSIIAAAHASGATAWVNTYDEYGIPGAGNTGRFQYTGQIWLAELGMYHYKARIYSPTLGRFLQTDPVGYDDQFNLYAYVGNDPINYTDPDGRRSIGEWFAEVAHDIGRLFDGLAHGRIGWALGGLPPTLGGGFASGAGTIVRNIPTIATGTRLTNQANAASRAARAEARAARAQGHGGATSGLVTRRGETFTGRSTNAGGPGRATNARVEAAVRAAPQGRYPPGC